MSALIYNIEHTRGDTFVSPKWLITNDEVPPGITEAELLLKIDNGEITPWDLHQYEIKAQLRSSPNTNVIFEFPITIDSYNRIGFIISHSMTKDMQNNPTTMVYDIQLTRISNGYVSTPIKGNYTITPDVTYESVNGA